MPRMLPFDAPLPRRPRRVLVAGVSGSGKTTFAARIARVLDAPHTELDSLFHGPGWVPREEFLQDVRALVAGETWTTEWQYPAARPLLIARADLLVWLDLPFVTVTLPWLVRRTVRRRLRHEVLWNGNVEPPLHTVFTDPEHVVRWAVAGRRKLHARVPTLDEHYPALTVVQLRSSQEISAWLAGPLKRSLAMHSGE